MTPVPEDEPIGSSTTGDYAAENNRVIFKRKMESVPNLTLKTN